MQLPIRQRRWLPYAFAALLWLPTAAAQTAGDSQTSSPTSAPAPRDLACVRLISFEYGDAQEWADAINILAGLSDSGEPLKIEVTEEGRGLALRGSSKNTARIESWINLIRRLADRQPCEVRTIGLENTSAVELAALLNKAALPANTDTPERAVTIVPDERTNSIVVTANPIALNRWAKVIYRLDAALAPIYDPSQSDATKLDLLVACVQCDPDALLALDRSTLEAKAKTPESFIEALREFGNVRTLATASGVLDISERSAFNCGTQAPFVQNRQHTKSGMVNASVSYEDAGMSFEIHGSWSASDASIGRYIASLEMCYCTDSSIVISKNAPLPTHCSARLDNGGEMTSGRPIVFFSSDTYDDREASRVVVCRLVLMKAREDQSTAKPD